VHRRIALVALMILILVADQVAKQWARVALANRPTWHYGFVTFVYAENRGAFLSLGSNLPSPIRAALLNGMVAIGLLVATIVLFRGNLKRGDDVALAMIVAGGVGNLIDRLRFDGRVTDFVYLSAGPVHTGVFNLADMVITFGVLWLLAEWAIKGRRGVER
jgi:signal peptidase II